ncbi:hypothetical protein E5J99_04840 [Hymenobacter elongatus]|uniref:Uncharacterized protein n=1 Tax=Hymenobacter elongatus TaxID=877208 RepID=A0A4Z0PNX6_9BACT|nr:hypothetical protein E5J99_04840 [Hymenobacter elongatus]
MTGTGFEATSTVKLLALVAVALPIVTVIGPVVDPTGIVALSCPVFTKVTVTAAVVLNLTLAALVKLVPLIVTSVPTGPLPGVKSVMVGVAALVVVTDRVTTLACRFGTASSATTYTS